MISNQYEPEIVTPPGETLDEMLEERGMTQQELARRMGRPKKTINEIIKGKAALTPESALQLERVLGLEADFWNERERHYRDYLARLERQQVLEQYDSWLKKLPTSQMVKLGWIVKQPHLATQVEELLNFFGVASPSAWEEQYANPQASYRRSMAYETDAGALSAWLRQGERQAALISSNKFSVSRLRSVLAEIRKLTPVSDPKLFVPRLQSICAQAGVAVVFVPGLKGLPVSGVTRWLHPDKALVQLSLRYKSDDHLWFTFFHEAAHILCHGKRCTFLESDKRETLSEEEIEADRFACDFLIPPPDYARLTSQGRLTRARIEAFATDLGIAPGIVVGRLQHDRRIPYKTHNQLKVRFQWAHE